MCLLGQFRLWQGYIKLNLLPTKFVTSWDQVLINYRSLDHGVKIIIRKLYHFWKPLWQRFSFHGNVISKYPIFINLMVFLERHNHNVLFCHVFLHLSVLFLSGSDDTQNSPKMALSMISKMAQTIQRRCLQINCLIKFGFFVTKVIWSLI